MRIREDGDSTYSEITPAPSAERAMEAVDDSIWHQQLISAEMDLLGQLRENQREMVYRYFFLGYNFEECDKDMGLRAGKSRILLQTSMDKLRKPINKHKLRSFLEFDYSRCSGLSTFRNTGMSVQEWYIIKKDTWKKT